MKCIHTPQSHCLFGFECAEITPPVGIYHRMWGAAQHDRSEGVHRPLLASASFFAALDEASKASPQVLVAVDHCLLGVEEVDMILDCAADRSDLPREAIAITFSHTHAAGLLNRDRQQLSGGELIPSYLEQLAETIAELVRVARKTAVAANIVYGTGRCNLAAQRDYFDEDAQQYVCGFNPAAEADDTVVVARVTDASEKLLLTFVNYACHPTTLAWDNRLISPDYPGATRALIEQQTGAPCVFLQGASGDLGPVEGFVGETAVADRNGRQLAYAALSALEAVPAAGTQFDYAGPVTSGALIGTWEHRPLAQQRHEQIATWTTDRESAWLPYRFDMAKPSEVEAERSRLLAAEQAARDTGNTQEAARLRALAERQTRMLGRLKGMPPGDAFPYRADVWRMGDAIWIALPGEPYNLLQRQLRSRFPATPILLATISGGWGPSYLPPRDAYGKGIYQTNVTSLAAGCLEQLIDHLTTRIENQLQPD